MSTAQEAPALIQYSCERCKTRFVLPPSSRKLGLRGEVRAFFKGGFGGGRQEARRDLLAEMDDNAYQSFVKSFRFCHECRQFVCNDCWSPSRRTCLSCVAKVMTGAGRPRSPVAPADEPVVAPAVERLRVGVAPRPQPVRSVPATPVPGKRRLRHDIALVALASAIVALSFGGGYLLVVATGGTANATPGPTNTEPAPTPTAVATATVVVTASPSATSASASASASVSVTPALPTTPPTPAIICNGQSAELTVTHEETVYCSWANPWSGSKTATWLLNGSPQPPPYKLAYDGPGTVKSVYLHVVRGGYEAYSNSIIISVTS